MNQHVKGALALALVTALSFGVILGTRALTSEPESSAQEGTPAQQSETLDVSGFEGLRGAERLLNGDGSTAGYAVTAAVKGYQSEIVTEVRFDSTGATITGVRVLEQGETEQVGSKVTEAAFLDQFAGVSAPVALSGAVDTEQDFGELADGEYEATGAESDGYTPTLRMTVEGGKITEVYWDEIGADGKGKRELSESGEYTMTEDGPIWAEQADALADALIESQSLSAFPTDEAGKTDAVSGVSISIGGFLSLAADCMEQASGTGQQDFGELADGEYEATGAESDGYTPTLRMTVEGGKITEVYWDEIGADGKGKRELSESGEYTMTEDGPIWAEQADALADALIESQSLSAFPTDEAGKTDAVSGVSISIGGFLTLAADCMEQASGTGSGTGQQAPEGTQIDAVSGATYSSTAVVEGVNLAYEFVQSIAG